MGFFKSPSELIEMVVGKGTVETVKTCAKAYEYITTDQEKEGRALGTTKAAEIYAPVLKELENELISLKNELDKEADDFDSQYKLLRNKAKYYVKQKEKVLKDIEKLKKKKPEISDFIDNCLGSGYSATNIVFQYYGGTVGDWLQEKMDTKRQEYFEIEFSKKVSMWKSKISEVKAEITQIATDLDALTKEDKQKLKKIASLVNQTITDYELVLEQYNSFKEIL